ncbi:MAG TPA: M20 family peptidase [Vicinamibacterales bacterium]|nr:M20 family peptidase [Vicinamibacterales bacterium]
MRTTRSPFILLLGSSIALLVGFVVAQDTRGDSTRAPAAPARYVTVPEGAGDRLAGAVRIRTISSEDPDAFDAEAFDAIHAYLRAAFPRVHRQLRRESVATHSLLYSWPGSDSSLKPLLLAGHLDVVPVEPGSDGKWQHDPFSGSIADGFVWGRGAIDNKAGVLGALEAVEMLLAEDFRPTRTVYLAFGHDEEVGGARGAREIAALLKARGVELEMVLDEGGVIGDGVLPGLSQPVALVGIAEKGFVSLELSVRTAGGHSSLPPPQSAVGILSAAIARLEANPMPVRLEGPTRQLFDRIRPRLPLLQRTMLANLWLTRPLLLRRLEKNSGTNAMVRTTAAPTIFQAGTKDNVLPADAMAVVNFRILPGDTVATVVEHVTRVVGDDRVSVKTAGRFAAEPSEVSSIDSEAFRTLERTIRSVAADVIVAPYLVVVVTDARYYGGLSRNVFRFLPLRLTSRELERMHGIDERIGIREYEAAIRTYRQLLIDAAGGRVDATS